MNKRNLLGEMLHSRPRQGIQGVNLGNLFTQKIKGVVRDFSSHGKTQGPGSPAEESALANVEIT